MTQVGGEKSKCNEPKRMDKVKETSDSYTSGSLIARLSSAGKGTRVKKRVVTLSVTLSCFYLAMLVCCLVTADVSRTISKHAKGSRNTFTHLSISAETVGAYSR